MKCALSVPLLYLLLSALPCVAELIDRDGTFGPSTVTFDSASGLEWLDVSLTVDISVLEIEEGFADGGMYAGWRYATPAELAFLFYESAGLPREPISHNYPGWPAETSLYEEAIRLFGMTFDSVLHGCMMCTHAVIGFNSAATEDGSRRTSDVSIFWQDSYMARVTYLAARVECSTGGIDRGAFLFGHWLVRDAGIIPDEKSSWSQLKAMYRDATR